MTPEQETARVENGPGSKAPLLSVRDLVAVFDTAEGPARIVDAISFDVQPGESVAIVGESGAGKSVLARAIVGLLSPGRIESGQVLLRGEELPEPAKHGDLSFIPQDATSSLDPLHSVNTQLADAIAAHRRVPRRVARELAFEALRHVGIAAPESQSRAYPHQLSMGMRRRVLLAMALSSQPRLLVADEPMTGLDAYSQADLIELLRRAKSDRQMGMMLVTHDLGVVAELADRVLVMYAGRLVEAGPVEAVLHDPLHPYTRTLIAAAWGGFVPPAQPGQRRLRLVEESHGPVQGPVHGCRFETACTIARTEAPGTETCRSEEPALRVTGNRTVRCHVAEVSE